MGTRIPLDLRDLILSYERLLSGIEMRDEHSKLQPLRQGLADEISTLHLQLVRDLLAAGASEQEANQAGQE